ncbi:MAG: hypothetical protein J6S85_07595 [Methanobrevibacter sp.]|nr:hypothetical protein [Methanobrevibacter sp.]
MTPELEEKISKLVEILYQNEYIDGFLYNTRKIDWTDKGEAFMKEKFGQLWSTSWPNFSQPEKIWLPYVNIKNAMPDAFNRNYSRYARDYWEYTRFDRWNEGDDKKFNLYLEYLQLDEVDYIELDDLIL